MTYIVNEKCIKCKLMDCVEVCPVDCFYEGRNMLVIKPDECIDCGVCEPDCPVDAIDPDTNNGTEKWLEINTKYSEIWPNISEKKDPPKDNEKYTNIAALLIHAAKIDEQYTEKEKKIIKKTLEEISNKEIKVEEVILDAEKLDYNSNQILDFTKTIKNLEENLKKQLVETLWRIIYSDKNVDLYESSLMRRLTGLLYIDSKTLGDIKNKISNENLK